MYPRLPNPYPALQILQTSQGIKPIPVVIFERFRQRGIAQPRRNARPRLI
jgi:hypothetical protein